MLNRMWILKSGEVKAGDINLALINRLMEYYTMTLDVINVAGAQTEKTTNLRIEFWDTPKFKCWKIRRS